MHYAAGMEPLPGYVLVRYLGAGCIGDVWEASGPGGTAAALKFIRLAGASGIKEYRAIQRVKRLVHPNLNPITACWLLDGGGKILNPGSRPHDVTSDGPAATLVIAMLLGSMSLQTRLSECRQMDLGGIPAEELLGYMEDAARGLDFLNQSEHGLGVDDPGPIQHGDIKPLNLLLVGNATQVCDFGLATALQDHRRSMERSAGTPAYMAPEICRGEAPSRHTDQYSLAISYYELRTGQLPMSEQDLTSITRVADAHKKNRLTFELTSDAEQGVLRRATALAPDDRYHSAREFVKQLRKAVDTGRLQETVNYQAGDVRKTSAETTPADMTASDVSLSGVPATSDAPPPSIAIPHEGIPHEAIETQHTSSPRATIAELEGRVPPIQKTRVESKETMRVTFVEPPVGPESSSLVRDTQVQPPNAPSGKSWSDTSPDPSRRRISGGLLGGMAAGILVVGGALGWPASPLYIGPRTPVKPVEPPKTTLPKKQPNAKDPDGKSPVQPIPPPFVGDWKKARELFLVGDMPGALQQRPDVKMPASLRHSVVHHWQAHEPPIDSMAFDPAAELITAAQDELRLWTIPGDAPNGKTKLSLMNTGEATFAVFSNDAQHLIVGRANGTIAVWEGGGLAGAAKATTSFPSAIKDQPVILSVAANGARCAAGTNDGEVARWPLQPTLPGDQFFGQPFVWAAPPDKADVVGLAFVGEHLVGLDDSGRLLHFQPTDSKPRVLYTLTPTKAGIALEASSRWVAAADESTLHVWRRSEIAQALDSQARRLATPSPTTGTGWTCPFSGAIKTCKFLSLGEADYLVVLTYAETLHIWDLAGEAPQWSCSIKQLAEAAEIMVSYSSVLQPLNNGRLAVALGNGQVVAVDLPTLILTLQPKPAQP